MEKQSADKSKFLYDTITGSNNFYSCPIDENVRSRINVPFRVGGPNGNEELEAKFLEEAEKLNMFQLKGHRSVGGIRASLYNAVTLDDVNLLVKFMNEFLKQYG
ncbi:Aminotran 5 domain containing protein [Asbolus verrucosus]|uniref:phosphoserine transaminase n=1 Tax=Asbolus verrucosus TaxID=1661398 RepID=A0A482VEV3_ASBVE|nr:Aminotran 5 domain containing protein [Asbolus verrucosus]